MAFVDIPDGWLAVVTSEQEAVQASGVPPYELVEVFGGSGHLSEAAIDCGLHAWKFELLDTPVENFLTDQAFQLSCQCNSCESSDIACVGTSTIWGSLFGTFVGCRCFEMMHLISEDRSRVRLRFGAMSEHWILASA
eukprot:6492546-Amphidinium_carterae.4